MAAQTVQAGIADNPVLKKALEAVPVTEYKLTWVKRPFRQTNIRDITQLRLYPGLTHAFSLQTPKVCRYQENWLKDVTEF